MWMAIQVNAQNEPPSDLENRNQPTAAETEVRQRAGLGYRPELLMEPIRGIFGNEEQVVWFSPAPYSALGVRRVAISQQLAAVWLPDLGLVDIQVVLRSQESWGVEQPAITWRLEAVGDQPVRQVTLRLPVTSSEAPILEGPRANYGAAPDHGIVMASATVTDDVVKLLEAALEQDLQGLSIAFETGPTLEAEEARILAVMVVAALRHRDAEGPPPMGDLRDLVTPFAITRHGDDEPRPTARARALIEPKLSGSVGTNNGVVAALQMVLTEEGLTVADIADAWGLVREVRGWAFDGTVHLPASVAYGPWLDEARDDLSTITRALRALELEFAGRHALALADLAQRCRDDQPIRAGNALMLAAMLDRGVAQLTTLTWLKPDVLDHSVAPTILRHDVCLTIGATRLRPLATELAGHLASNLDDWSQSDALLIDALAVVSSGPWYEEVTQGVEAMLRLRLRDANDEDPVLREALRQADRRLSDLEYRALLNRLIVAIEDESMRATLKSWLVDPPQPNLTEEPTVRIWDGVEVQIEGNFRRVIHPEGLVVVEPLTLMDE